MGAYGEAIVAPFGKGNPLHHHPCGGLARRRRALVAAELAGPRGLSGFAHPREAEPLSNPSSIHVLKGLGISRHIWVRTATRGLDAKSTFVFHEPIGRERPSRR